MLHKIIFICLLLSGCYAGGSGVSQSGGVPVYFPTGRQVNSRVYDRNFKYPGTAVTSGGVTSLFPASGGQITTCVTTGRTVSCYLDGSVSLDAFSFITESPNKSTPQWCIAPFRDRTCA